MFGQRRRYLASWVVGPDVRVSRAVYSCARMRSFVGITVNFPFSSFASIKFSKNENSYTVTKL